MKQNAIDTGLGPDISPQETVRQLSGEIGMLREELTRLVAEVDRRRHDALDVKLQVRRHALEVSLAGAALVAVLGFSWLGARRAFDYRMTMRQG